MVIDAINLSSTEPEAAPSKPQNGPSIKINAYAPSTEFPHTGVQGRYVDIELINAVDAGPSR